MDLANLYKVLHWQHTQRDKPLNESVGCFIVLPTEIAKQYPQVGKQGEDDSPSHITTFFIGDVLPNFEEPIIETLRLVIESFRKFKVKIKKPKTFENDKGQYIYHSPIASPKLFTLNATLQKAFQYKQLPYSKKWPEFKPHCTIAYCNSKEELENYRDIQPVGDFEVDQIWLWRLKRTLSFSAKVKPYTILKQRAFCFFKKPI